MPRLARFIEMNGFYHVVSRSLNETRVLRDNDDFCHFLSLAYAAKQKYPIQIFHYVIMNTHFHFVVQAPTHKILSQNISYIKWHYTLWSRKKYNWMGPLWRERYRSLAIENQDYLYACGMYIEFNPVRAGICENPVDYPYSSYRKYHSQINDTLVDDYEISNNSEQSMCLGYRTDIAKQIFSLSPAIGTNSFIKKMKCLSQK